MGRRLLKEDHITSRLGKLHSLNPSTRARGCAGAERYPGRLHVLSNHHSNLTRNIVATATSIFLIPSPTLLYSSQLFFFKTCISCRFFLFFFQDSKPLTLLLRQVGMNEKEQILRMAIIIVSIIKTVRLFRS